MQKYNIVNRHYYELFFITFKIWDDSLFRVAKLKFGEKNLNYTHLSVHLLGFGAKILGYPPKVSGSRAKILGYPPPNFGFQG